MEEKWKIQIYAPLLNEDLTKSENSLLLELESDVRGGIWSIDNSKEQKSVS